MLDFRLDAHPLSIHNVGFDSVDLSEVLAPAWSKKTTVVATAALELYARGADAEPPAEGADFLDVAEGASLEMTSVPKFYARGGAATLIFERG